MDHLALLEILDRSVHLENEVKLANKDRTVYREQLDSLVKRVIVEHLDCLVCLVKMARWERLDQRDGKVYRE